MIVHLHNCSEKELVFTGNGNIFTLPVKYIEDYGHETNPFDNEFKLPKGFSLCCDYHKLLSKNTWFSKKRYKYVVVRILKNFKYCQNYIDKYAFSEENLKDCRDYIDYCYYSFGIHGVGTDKFLGLLKTNIPLSKIPETNKKNLIDHCNSYYTNQTPQSDIDFITINDMFQKWTDSIPDLPSFSEIKKSLSSIVPINLFARDKRHNKFTGRTSFLLKNESEFINDLTQLTKNLLSQYSNNDTKEVDIFKANHKTKQDKLLDKYTITELNYVKIFSK